MQKPLFGAFPQFAQQPQPQPALVAQQPANVFASNQQQPSTAPFGANTQTNAGTLFGSNANTTGPQPAQNPFGPFAASTNTAAAQPTPSLFAQQQQQQQWTAPNPSTTPTPIFTRSTKFNDLPDDIRKKFEHIDAHIQGRVQISEELKQYKLADEPRNGADHIRAVHKDLVNSINKLRVDIAGARALRAQMDQAIQDTVAATRVMDAFRSPSTAASAQMQAGLGGSLGGQMQMQQQQQQQQQSSVWLKNYANFPLEFFSRVTEQLRERLQWVNSSLEQIERTLAAETNHATVTPQSITSTLQAQHASFVALASKAAGLDAELQTLKDAYRALWRAHTGSARDPFSAVDRGLMAPTEFGLEGLSVK